MTRRQFSSVFLTACTTLLVVSCTAPHTDTAPGKSCDAGSFTVVDDFEGARRGVCQVYPDDRVVVHITPEASKTIHHSPWYAFRILPLEKTRASITLSYHDGKHRYWPKFSYDRVNWQRLPESAVTVSADRLSATFEIDLDTRPIWVSGQELVMPSDIERWVDGISSSTVATASVLGASVEGRSIHVLNINPTAKDVVLLVGRQHPAEVTGSFGFQGFYEAIVADTGIAKDFREKFHVVAVPMLNPDGVVAGNWRHNSQGIDLNRDWGPFTQAETRLMEGLLHDLDEHGKRIIVFIDFHSTVGNLMYTQTSDVRVDNPDFLNDWIAAALPRLGNFVFTAEPRPNSETANSKNYMYKRYKIPAVTFEVSDAEIRSDTIEAAGIFAEEMMRLLNSSSH